MTRLSHAALAALLLGVSTAFVAGALAQDKAQNQAPAASDKPYVVNKDGKVDQHTFNGWRRYTESCLRCHGPDGAGSSYAPNLTESLKHMGYEDFANTVINGRQNLTAGQEKVMPAFGLVPDVAQYLDDIYAYLKARSDGVLGRGRPEKLPPDKDPKASS
jgi:methanol metabolism-related c-type cytochrome